MPEESKPSWPKTPTGTTDWETVFEDPRAGLIPLISQAHSAPALRKSTILILEKLHARTNDPKEVKRFTAELNRLVPDDIAKEDLAPIIEAVAAILRRIKEERVEKTLRHDRQRRIRARPRKNRRSKNPVRRRRIVVWSGLGAAAAGLIAYAVLVSLAPEEKKPYLVLIEQMNSAALGEEIDTHILGGALSIGREKGKQVVTAEAVPSQECLNISWILINHGSVVINGMMSRRMSPRIIEDLCAQKGEKATVAWYPKKAKTGK